MNSKKITEYFLLNVDLGDACLEYIYLLTHDIYLLDYIKT